MNYIKRLINKFKIIFLFGLFLANHIAMAATVTATYSGGDIPTGDGSWPGGCTASTLQLTIPAGAIVTGVDVSYDIQALNSGWMSDQRSQVYYQEGSTDEGGVISGSGFVGTQSYNRTNLTLANGVSVTGTLTFEMRAYRTWSSGGEGGCNDYNNRINDNTWTITVNYTDPITAIDTDSDGVPDDIDIDDDNDGILDTRENVADQTDTYSGGNGGSSHPYTYTYGDATSVMVDFHPIDNSFNINIEGITLLQNGKYLDLQEDSDASGTKLLFADDASMTTPWVAHNSGLPRVRVIIDETGAVSIYGTRTTSSATLELMHTENGDLFNTLYFEAGSRTLTVINPDGPGPDGLSATNTVSPNRDFDGDGLTNDLDLDSDNDGIPDNIEAQSTVGYIAPNDDAGPGNNGLDTAYTGGLTPVNTFTTSGTDYLNSDTDGDGATDCEEGLKYSSSTSNAKDCSDFTNVGNNGLVIWAESDDTYGTVYGNVGQVTGAGGDLYNDENDGGEVNYRDETTTVPVTISYAYPQLNGNSLDLAFSTATETANVGFNVYAVKGKGKQAKQWTKLNVETIPSTVFDSLIPTDYQVTLAIPDDLEVKKIGIAGVDVDGKEDRHGPFKINKESGSKGEVVPITWESIRSAVKQDKKERKAKRQANKASRQALRKTMKDQIVNIEVDQNAVYRITHEALMAEDIDLRGFKADKIAVSLRGEGVARVIEELTEKGKWTENSTIEFVGEAPKDSDALYLSSNLYRLSFNKKQVVQSEGIESVTAKELVFEENNAYSWTIPGPDPFYDKMFYTRGAETPGSATHTFTLDEVPDTEMELSIHVSGFSKLTHNLGVALNGSDIGSIQQSGYGELVIQNTISAAMLNQGENQITITAQGEGTNIDVFMYDKTVLTYDDGQANEVQTPVISFNDRLRKKEIKPKRGTTYLIISHPLFIGETLDRYVTQKEGEGWNIQVVDVEDIYSAYGYGMATPEAIKTYLDVAKRKGVTHVQLVGAASYDYHDYLGLGSVSFIPSIYVPTGEIVNYTPCDSCLVADENGIPELAIGRWPVRTTAGLEAVVNKSLDWKNSGQAQSHSALFIADQKDEALNLDFTKQMETLYKQFEETGTWHDMTRVYLDEYIANAEDENTAVQSAKDNIIQTLSNGASVTSYSGHSAPSLWSYKGLLKQDAIANITNEGQTSVALPLACYTTYADSPTTKTLAHQFLVEGEHGAVAIYGAATLSYFSDNGVSAKKVIAYLLQGETIGEAVRKAKVDLGTSYMDVVRNSNLLGDVTIKID